MTPATQLVSLDDVAQALGIPVVQIRSKMQASAGEPAFFSIPDLARRWSSSRGHVYNVLRNSGVRILDFGGGGRGKKLVPRQVVLDLEAKHLRRLT